MDHKIKLHPSGQAVPWAEGLTALEALERAGYACSQAFSGTEAAP